MKLFQYIMVDFGMVLLFLKIMQLVVLCHKKKSVPFSISNSIYVLFPPDPSTVSVSSKFFLFNSMWMNFERVAETSSSRYPTRCFRVMRGWSEALSFDEKFNTAAA